MTHFTIGLAIVLLIAVTIAGLGLWLNSGNERINRIGGGR